MEAVDESPAEWKRLAEERLSTLQQLEQQFKEFQDDSALLEQELEQELKSVQEKWSEAERTIAKLRSEMEHTKSKSHSLGLEVSDLQGQVRRLTDKVNATENEKRDLEQINDELERQERIASVMVSSLQDRLEALEEESIFLKTELDESRTASDEEIQRLKDRCKELEDDLSVRSNSISTQDNNSNLNQLVDSSVIQDLKQQIEDLQTERAQLMNQVHELTQRTSILEDLKLILSKLKFNFNDELASESVITTVSFQKSELLHLKTLQSELGIDSRIESEDMLIPPPPSQPDTVEPESELHSDKEKHTADSSSSVLPVQSEVSENVPQLLLGSTASVDNIKSNDSEIEMKLKQTLQALELSQNQLDLMTRHKAQLSTQLELHKRQHSVNEYAAQLQELKDEVASLTAELTAEKNAKANAFADLKVKEQQLHAALEKTRTLQKETRSHRTQIGRRTASDRSISSVADSSSKGKSIPKPNRIKKSGSSASSVSDQDGVASEISALDLSLESPAIASIDLYSNSSRPGSIPSSPVKRFEIDVDDLMYTPSVTASPVTKSFTSDNVSVPVSPAVNDLSLLHESVVSKPAKPSKISESPLVSPTSSPHLTGMQPPRALSTEEATVVTGLVKSRIPMFSSRPKSAATGPSVSTVSALRKPLSIKSDVKKDGSGSPPRPATVRGTQLQRKILNGPLTVTTDGRPSQLPAPGASVSTVTSFKKSTSLVASPVKEKKEMVSSPPRPATVRGTQLPRRLFNGSLTLTGDGKPSLLPAPGTLKRPTTSPAVTSPSSTSERWR